VSDARPSQRGAELSEIGRYQILGFVGRGGMADVYLASSLGMGSVRKLLVLKRLRADLATDPDFVAMFLDEARLAARMSHPNVVQSYEFGTDEGLPFIAMEYLDGQPLHRVIARLGPRLGLAARMRVLVDLLAGLHYVHELRDYDGSPLSVAHRDVNPQNVFVSYDGHVKLVDFGIAKTAESIAQTRLGMFKGKLGYMAPEQVRGEVVDRRVDVFAVGAMLAECIVSRPLWPAATDLEIANRLATGSIPWPVDGIEVEPGLAAIVARALAPAPDDRYATAEGMRADLAAALATRPDVPNEADLGAVVSETFAEERAQRREMIGRGLRSTMVGDASSAFADDDHRPEDLTRRLPDSVVTSSVGVAPTVVGAGRRLHIAIAGIAAAIAGIAVMSGRREVSPAPESAPRPSAPIAAESVAPVAERATGVATGQVVALTGDLDTDATLFAGTTYRLEHSTFVAPGVTLTIEPGTTILGDAETRGTLVVRPGGRLVAEGTAERPIVFTSSRAPAQRRPGDWGGVLLLGRAPTNAHGPSGDSVLARVEGLPDRGGFGGDDPGDSSGVLRWVRIEYSGFALGPNNEINGLTLAGVGNGTTIDHVAVRDTGDDCFEFFGGTVDATHLYCEAPGDDAFDWDLGYAGRLQFLFAVDLPDEPGSNGIEGDNAADGRLELPRSAPSIANATLCGPSTDRAGERYGILVRNGTAGRIDGALVLGFDAGIDVRGANTDVRIDRSVFASMRSGVLAFDERVDEAGGPREDDDEGLDEVATYLPYNSLHAQLPVTCTATTAADVVGPARQLHPFADPWFDATAQFAGAQGDGHRWLAGPWLGD